MNTKFITTTLPYVNSKPHIGHAFEFVLADVIARFYKATKNVFFNVGIDEHGLKVQQAAEREGVPTQKYCDDLSDLWKEFCAKFDIGYDNFYRTSSDEHKRKVLEYFNLINNPKYIYKKHYTGKYCVGCESYITDKDLIDSKCSTHNTIPQETNEENWFFNLATFRDQIPDILINKKLSNELKNISATFDEVSISRQNVEWGIRFDNENTFYVWFEALLNYVIAAGWGKERNFERLWSDSLIICGPDNLKFQAYILPAILLAAAIPPPTGVLVHGNINDANGKKQSKSLGNVIDPIDQLEKFGVSPVRFYLFSGLSIFESSSYSEDALVKLWNSEIVNNYGNLVSRLLHLIDIRQVKIEESYFEIRDGGNIHQNDEFLNSLFEDYKYTEFNVHLFKLISDLNKRITDEKPFDKGCLNYSEVLTEIYWTLKHLSKYICFIIPEYKDRILQAFKDNKKAVLFQKIEQ